MSGRCHIGVVPLAAPRRRRAGSVVRGPEPPRINIDDLMLDVPEIDGDIRSLQVEMGAIFNVRVRQCVYDSLYGSVCTAAWPCGGAVGCRRWVCRKHRRWSGARACVSGESEQAVAA